MHPAFSVIFLTTLLGVGQGLFLALYTGQLYALARLLPVQDNQSFYGLGSALGVGCLIAGLIASFFHLGHPERAWRAAARWRSSWLSREVIMLPALIVLIALYGIVHWFGWTRPLFVVAGALPVDLSLLIGALATLVTFALYVCTAMIYASVKFLQEWHSPLTVINYILLGGASGFTLAAAFSAWVGASLVGFYAIWAVILTLSAFASRVTTLIRNRRLRPRSMPQTAIAQKTQGAMGGPFNTREFFQGRSQGTVDGIKYAFLILTFPLPVVLLAAAYALSSPTLPLYAFVAQYLGLLAERWYFFAEARHPQNLYYQSVS